MGLRGMADWVGGGLGALRGCPIAAATTTMFWAYDALFSGNPGCLMI